MNKKTLEKLPKVDLHCHLDGSIRTQTILEMAREQNHQLPAQDVKELRKHVRVPLDCKSLGDFLKRFEVFYPLLRNPAALERIAYELLRDCAAENTKYIEIRFAPVLHKTDSFPVPAVIESVLKGTSRGQKDFGIKCGVILCLYRGTPVEESLLVAKYASMLKDSGVCGVDIAGDESKYPLADFIKPIEICKKDGIRITIHAGEAGGPGNIRQAIQMGADRIGHGTTLVKDSALMELVAKQGIPLEVCLTSNIHTQVVESYKTHPVTEFLKNGVNVTLNTDDRGVSGIDLTYEYLMATHIGVSDSDLIRIILNGAEAAFISNEEKKKLTESIKKEAGQIIKKTDIGQISDSVIKEKLVRTALEYRKRAHAPYSNFYVGAAAEGGSGKIYGGCNVENASYGLTICAERVAITKAVSEGEKKITRIAVATGQKETSLPCGACRQVLIEFGKEAEVICCGVDGKYDTYTASELLAHFDSGDVFQKALSEVKKRSNN